MSLTESNNLTSQMIMGRLRGVRGGGLYSIKSVFQRCETNGWQCCAVQIERVEETEDSIDHIYSRDAFFRSYETFESVEHIFERLGGEGIFVSLGFPRITMSSDEKWAERLVPSFLLEGKRPAREYCHALRVPNFGPRRLVSFSLPYYESHDDYLENFIKPFKDQGTGIYLTVEDTRDYLLISGSSVSCRKGGGSYEACDVVGNIHYISGETVEVTEDGLNDVSLDGASSVNIWLVGASDKIYDYISTSVFLGKYELPETPISLEEHCDALLEEGESDVCEFKKYIELKSGHPKIDDIPVAVCAMSNSSGGTLVIGVSDRLEVVGIDHDVRKTYKSTIEDAIEEYKKDVRRCLYESLSILNCFDVSHCRVRGKSVIAVSIRKIDGINTVLATGIPYIRIGANSINGSRHYASLALAANTFQG